MNKIRLTCCVVIYNENEAVLKRTIDSFLSIPFSKKIFIVDNSSISNFKIENTKEVEYIKNERNIGFGRGHNQILKLIEGKSDFHLVLNPDVEFEGNIFKKLFSILENNEKTAMISPKVLNNDGSLQFTCRKNPTIKEMISRRLGINKEYVEEREYRNIDLNKSFTPEFIYGCFMLFKTKDFIYVGGFDNRYFLYLEDADLCREVRRHNKELLYFPEVEIKHLHRKGSSKRLKLLFYHIASAYKYFRKWKN